VLPSSAALIRDMATPKALVSASGGLVPVGKELARLLILSLLQAMPQGTCV